MINQAREILAFDVGGTNVRAGLYCPASNTLNSVKRVNTPNHITLPEASSIEILGQLFKTISSLGFSILQDTQPKTVVFSFPGPVDHHGYALAAPTICGDRWHEPVNLKESLREIWPFSTILVINDVTAAGYRYINGPNDDLCIITISSGIGSKLFVNGRALIGPNGRGGEIGHVRVDLSPDALVCECGGIGHLGALASGRSSAYQAHRLFDDGPEAFISSALGHRLGGDVNRITNELIVQFNQQGDAWARKLVQKMAQPLGQMLASLHLATGIDRFVIIGGFALALGETYRRDLVHASAACAWGCAGDWDSMIELGVADDNSGLIGAGYYGAMYAHADES